MPSTLSIDNNIQVGDLKEKLKETNLSDDQIKEIIPVILSTLSEIKKIENSKTEISTRSNLNQLSQSIQNDNNVSIDMKNNKWTVIWAMNFNTITNNISITINNSQQLSQSEAQHESEGASQPTEFQQEEQIEENQQNIQSNEVQQAEQPSEQQQTIQSNEQQEVSQSAESQQTTSIQESQQIVQSNEAQEPEQPSQQQQSVQSNEQQEVLQSTELQQNFQSVETQPQTVESNIDILSRDWYLLTLDELLNEIKDTKEWITKKWVWKSWKETMRLAKTKLKQYEKAIKTKKRAIENQTNPQIFESDINQARKLKSDIDAVRQDVSLWQWWELSNLWSFLYNSPENAKKSNRQQDKLNQFAEKYKEEVKNWAILNIFGRHEQTAIDFYRRIAEWRYDQADYQLFQENAQILTPSFQRCWIAIPISPDQRTILLWSNWSIDRIQGGTHRSVDYRNLDRWETFKKWWLAWVVDKALSSCNNLTPGQRETWKNIAVLWGYAAWIYWLFKFFTSDQKRWKKAWITAAAIFGTQVLTWENPFSLFQKAMTWWLSWDELSYRFWNSFWDAVDWVQNSGIENGSELSWAMYSLMVFNNTATVWEIRGRSTKFKNDPQSWTQFRLAAKEKIWAKHFEKFSATFSENFDENKRNNRLNSIGIHDGIDDNKLIYEIASYKTMNTIIINKFLSDNWVKVTDNSTKKEEFEQYKKSCNDNNQTMDITILNNHKNDRFMPDNEATFTDRPEDKQNREKLNNQVDQLSLDDQKKSELKTAIIRFYDERTIASKPNPNDFDLKIENWKLVLTSHWWYEAEIDLDKKELVWFWSWITFTNLSDLLNVADLSNKILKTQKWKTPKDLPPFQYKWPTTVLENWVGKKWRWIYFNDAEWRNLDFDTRVLSGGWWWKMWEIKELEKNPEAFADYLTQRWEKANKLDINMNQYPTIKKLSDSWIIFFNEKEVKQAEVRLNKIKEARSTANGWPAWYEPFSIDGDKLIFTTINGEKIAYPDSFDNNFSLRSLNLSNFPAIKTNKDNFLKFMNDKKNWMWWSKLNTKTS